jgi:hypothetical protein
MPVSLKVQIGKFSWYHTFYLAKIPFPVLLGVDFIRKSNMIVRANPLGAFHELAPVAPERWE